MRRLRRWLARGLVAGALVAAALAVASRTGAVRALERRAVVRVLESATGEHVTLAGVGGTLGHSLVLEDLRLGAGGRTVVHVPRLEIVYAPLALVHGVVRLKHVTLTAPRLRPVVGGEAPPLVLPPRAAAEVRALAPRSALATDLRARVRRRGPWHALAVRAHADLGRGGGLHARAVLDATARPVAYAAQLAFARLDPAAVLLRLPHVEASGQLAFRGEGGALRLRGEVRTPLGEAALQGRLAPGTPPAYHLAARVSLPRLEALDARAAGAASGRVRLDGRGFDAADRHVRAHLVLTHAVLRGVSLEHGAARAVVDGAHIRLASARVTGPELHAHASGTLDPARSVADLTLAARADLTRLGPRLGH